MTRHELEWLDSELDDARHDDRSRQRRERPRRSSVQFSKQRRPASVPLGINARGGRRSTYRSLTRGKVRTQSVLPVVPSCGLVTAQPIQPNRFPSHS